MGVNPLVFAGRADLSIRPLSRHSAKGPSYFEGPMKMF